MALVALAYTVLLVAAIWIAAPLIKKPDPSVDHLDEQRMNDLFEAKMAVYQSILDLEFDRKTDKVSEEDYRSMRAQHEAEALRILAEIGSAQPIDALEMEIAAARERLRR